MTPGCPISELEGTVSGAEDVLETGQTGRETATYDDIIQSPVPIEAYAVAIAWILGPIISICCHHAMIMPVNHDTPPTQPPCRYHFDVKITEGRILPLSGCQRSNYLKPNFKYACPRRCYWQELSRLAQPSLQLAEPELAWPIRQNSSQTQELGLQSRWSNH